MSRQPLASPMGSPATSRIDEAHRIAVEQCAYLRSQGVELEAVCVAIGRRPVRGWDQLAWVLAAELRRAWSILSQVGGVA
jgi:hypothetical protein